MTEPEVHHIGLRLLLLGIILAVNAFFAAAEVSLLSVRESRLRQLAAQGQTAAKVALNLLAQPEKLFAVTQLGVTLASLGLGWAGEDTLFSLIFWLFHPILTPITSAVLHGLSFVLAFLVMSYCHVMIGEVVPKNLAIAKAERLAIIVAPVLMIVYRILAPFVFVIERSAAMISNALGTRSLHRGGGHSTEEIKLIVSSSRGSGHLPEVQEDMIHRVLDLDEVSVREIMTPRNAIVSVPADASLDQVLHHMIEQQHSRLPVYEGGPEHIIGVLYFKDLLPVWQDRRTAVRLGRQQRFFRVAPLMRKHLIVPETKLLPQMLEEFRQGRSHMAIVVDEFGTISGLVTVEDVLEQIVGEIEDEFDEKRQLPSIEADNVELDGATNIRDFELQYGIDLPNDSGFETIAGFLLFRLGHIPVAGESIQQDGRRFTVLTVERNRIARVRVEKITAPEEPVQAG